MKAWSNTGLNTGIPCCLWEKICMCAYWKWWHLPFTPKASKIWCSPWQSLLLLSHPLSRPNKHSACLLPQLRNTQCSKGLSLLKAGRLSLKPPTPSSPEGAWEASPQSDHSTLGPHPGVTLHQSESSAWGLEALGCSWCQSELLQGTLKYLCLAWHHAR